MAKLKKEHQALKMTNEENKKMLVGDLVPLLQSLNQQINTVNVDRLSMNSTRQSTATLWSGVSPSRQTDRGNFSMISSVIFFLRT